ncbi:MAG: DUF4116 domain-containing protein [Treponema sp.]|nr:DUF4116 domain-containing protein [Treponema sp.]
MDAEIEKLLDKAKQSWCNLIFVPKEQLTVELCHVAVEHDGMALQCVPQKLRTVELWMAAVKQNDDAFWDIPEKLRKKEIRNVAGINPYRWAEKQDAGYSMGEV